MIDKKVDIEGMHCAACSTRIERVVTGLEGVEKAEVNLATESMNICWNEHQIEFADIEQCVKELGFYLVQGPDESTLELQYTISGMHCAACSTRIEKVVSGLEGIDRVEVNLVSESAQITMDSQRCSNRKIRKAITDLGFEVTSIDESSNS
ncbi:MAG: copper ion binding protein, partial [Bacteroidetes bacterium]|nr:copper ion binding protein [Bacteroidota bacterium]